MGTAAQRIDLSGVRLSVETDHTEFAEYLAAHCPPPELADRAPDVVVRVRWTEGNHGSLDPRSVFPDWPVDTRLGRHVQTSDDRMVVLTSDDAPMLALAAAPGGAPRRFELRYHFGFGGGWRERLVRTFRASRLPALRRKRFSTLTYYAVYYPAWWHLESERRTHPLHAAGIAVQGRGLLLGGLPGCGKSTLALSMLASRDADLLSDNVVLHSPSAVMGCFEPLLLDARSRALLGADVPLVPLGRQHQFGRDAFAVPHRTEDVPLAAAVMLARGPRTRLEPIDPRECARALLAATQAAKEVRRYHVLAGLLALRAPETLGHLDARLADLDALLAHVPCYWLTIREGAPAEGVDALRGLVGSPRHKEIAS